MAIGEFTRGHGGVVLTWPLYQYRAQRLVWHCSPDGNDKNKIICMWLQLTTGVYIAISQPNCAIFLGLQQHMYMCTLDLQQQIVVVIFFPPILNT